MSRNTKVIPLNREGALELDFCPCDCCNVGWSSFSIEKTESCKDTCEYWKRYCKKWDNYENKNSSK